MYKDLEIRGAKQISDSLEVLPKRVEKRVVQQSLKKAAKPMVKSMKNLAPTRTGTLKKSIGSVTKKVSNPHLFVVKVGPRLGGSYEGYHGHLVEFGTSKMKADPFVRPTFIKKRREFASVFVDSALDGIMKQVDLIRKKGKV